MLTPKIRSNDVLVSSLLNIEIGKPDYRYLMLKLTKAMTREINEKLNTSFPLKVKRKLKDKDQGMLVLKIEPELVLKVTGEGIVVRAIPKFLKLYNNNFYNGSVPVITYTLDSWADTLGEAIQNGVQWILDNEILQVVPSHILEASKTEKVFNVFIKRIKATVHIEY